MRRGKSGEQNLFANAEDVPDEEPGRLAEGSVTQKLEWRNYHVLIKYAEPTYASHSGGQARVYRWTYRFAALSATQAEALAVKDFREMEKLSSVGWARDIVGITTTEE